jgi:uncharacterized protein (UPF0261 family)
MNVDRPTRISVVVMGTLDTKSAPLAFLVREVAAAGCRVLALDVSTSRAAGLPADLPAEPLAPAAPEELERLRLLPRGEAVEAMSRAAAACLARLVASGEVQGVVGVGGSGGTTICAAAMRELPYGLPKVLVSTLASGNTRVHVGTSDIVMMPSVSDVAGLHPLLELILSNAARAVAAMAHGYRPYAPSGRRVVGLTMYGTTTPGVARTAELLEAAGCEPWIFHASGIGGRTLERLVVEGRVQGTVDMTLAEIGAHLVGGLHDAGPDRLEAAGARGLPQVVVPGAADTIVLPPRDQVPERFRGRTLNFHNPTMTTMRTTPDENVEIGRFIARKLRRARGPVTVVLPLGGLSSIDRPGKVFHDPAANRALFDTLRTELSPPVRLVEDDRHIDDPGFAARVADEFLALAGWADERQARR